MLYSGKRLNGRKKIKIILSVSLFAVLLLPSFTYAFGSWNQETTARELCFLYTLSNDWQQTLDIAKNPSVYSEQNPILGSHPDVSSVNLYFATCAATHALVSYILPPKYSKIWQVTWIGLQSNVTENNNNNGLDQAMNIEYVVKFSVPF